MFKVAIIITHYGEQTSFLERCRNIRLQLLGLYDYTYFIESDNTYAKKNLSLLWNELSKSCNTEWVCFLNPDVLLTPNWLKSMFDAIQSDDNKDNIAVIGPSANEGSTKMDVPFTVGMPPSFGELLDLETHARTIHGAGDRIIRENAKVYGHCYMVRKSIFDELGGFDTDFPLYGQDTDYNNRVIENGYRVVQARQSYVWHWGGYTGRNEIKRISIDKKNAVELCKQKQLERKSNNEKRNN